MTAARAGQVPVIRVLAAAGASLEIRDRRSTGWTALIHAIHKDRTEAVQALLAAGADANARCEGGTTPLMFAAAYGNTGIVRSLLDEGADPRVVAEGGVSALWNALGGGGLFDLTDGPSIGTCHPETVRLLLERAPDLELEPGIATRVVKSLARSKECSELISRIQPR